MSLAVAFDTHKFVRKLKGAGFNDLQAEALTDAVQESQASLDVATKRDIDDLRKDMDIMGQHLEAKLEKLGLQLTVRFGIMLAAAIPLTLSISKLLHLT